MDKIIDAYKRYFTNYTNFNDRTSRSDYWYVVLANFIVGFALGFIGGVIPALAFLGTLYSLATLVPGLAIVVRRLHDINKSGWYYLMCLIPLAGFIIVLIYLCQPSVNENNKYGQTV